MWFLLRKKWFWLILLIIFLGNIIWPIRQLFSPKFLFSTHLIVLTNEAELRPCGGFVTVYGKFRAIPPKIELKNVYALKNADFGESPSPINQVAKRLRFWDLGNNPNLSECTETFYKSAESMDLDIDDVILLDISTIEAITKNSTIFSELTRAVANTDRHDEESLKSRKSPLISIGKKIIWETVIRPWKWIEISREIANKINNGNVFISNISPEIYPKDSDFALYEWNLGGGKSSRFLQKKLEITARETDLDTWIIQGNIKIEHLGQYDEPLSQDWKGIFELKFPTIFNQENKSFNINISPGENWEESFSFDYNGPLNSLSIFNQRGQTLFLDFNISLFGQQTFAQSNFNNHENVGNLYKKMTKFREKMIWQKEKDNIQPFITMHEWSRDLGIVPKEFRGKWSDFFVKSNRRFSLAEIHFSEPVTIGEDFSVEITDKNFENKNISENPEFEDIILFNYGRTALIGFWQNQVQPNERFSIKFRGIFDKFNNEISLKKYTIIDRISE